MKLRVCCILLVFVFVSSLCLKAQNKFVDSVEVNFKVSKWDLNPAVGDNAARLDSIDDRFTTIFGDSIYRVSLVSIIGGASPEGSVSFNEFLSKKRAATLFDYLSKYRKLTEADKDYAFLGRNWDGVLALARVDSNLPYRDETIALLESIADEKRLTGKDPARSLERVKELRNGVPYNYLLEKIFPKVRASKVIMYYDKVQRPEVVEPELPRVDVDSAYVDTVEVVAPDTAIVLPVLPLKPFYMDIRTNMLLDVLALPTIGVDFYLGKNISIGANWTYGWWKSDRVHRYWRAYGGDINVRYWFGNAAKSKPLTGHHVGIYGGILTYDFEWGGTGYMGGRPGHNLWDRFCVNAGVEYGYSLPVARRLNIDFTIGIGYLGGTVEKYTPINGYYYWESTSRRRWFGPTKAEISLVWLIGRGNVNNKKGGGR